MCGARQQVWDWIRSYTKPGTVYNPVKPLREGPICELPELSHILQQLLWYYNTAIRRNVRHTVMYDLHTAYTLYMYLAIYGFGGPYFSTVWLLPFTLL